MAAVGIAACLSVESSCLTGSPAECAVVRHMMYMSIPDECRRIFFQICEGNIRWGDELLEISPSPDPALIAANATALPACQFDTGGAIERGR